MARPPANAAPAKVPQALTEWPPPPGHFDAEESASWVRLGEAALSLGRITEADLLAAEAFCEVDALFRRAKADPDMKVTSLTALAGRRLQHLQALGLTSVARKGVGAVAEGESRDAGRSNLARLVG